MNKKKMSERPTFPTWCARICAYANTDKCMTECWPQGDASWFEMKDLDIDEIPRFPLEEFLNEMTPIERQTVVAVYLAKVVDVLKGVKDEPGRSFKGQRSSPIPPNEQNTSLRIDCEKTHSPYKIKQTQDSNP